MRIEALSAPAFLARFESANDGILRTVHYQLAAGGSRSRLVVELSVQDVEAEGGWSNLVLSADDVREMSLKDGRASVQVLSGGMSLSWHDGLLYCDLSPYASESTTLEDIRRSGFFFAARECTWEAKPYGDSQVS